MSFPKCKLCGHTKRFHDPPSAVNHVYVPLSLSVLPSSEQSSTRQVVQKSVAKSPAGQY